MKISFKAYLNGETRYEKTAVFQRFASPEYLSFLRTVFPSNQLNLYILTCPSQKNVYSYLKKNQIRDFMIAEADLEPDPGFYESAGGPGTFLNFRKKVFATTMRNFVRAVENKLFSIF